MSGEGVILGMLFVVFIWAAIVATLESDEYAHKDGVTKWSSLMGVHFISTGSLPS